MGSSTLPQSQTDPNAAVGPVAQTSGQTTSANIDPNGTTTSQVVPAQPTAQTQTSTDPNVVSQPNTVAPGATPSLGSVDPTLLQQITAMVASANQPSTTPLTINIDPAQIAATAVVAVVLSSLVAGSQSQNSNNESKSQPSQQPTTTTTPESPAPQPTQSSAPTYSSSTSATSSSNLVSSDPEPSPSGTLTVSAAATTDPQSVQPAVFSVTSAVPAMQPTIPPPPQAVAQLQPIVQGVLQALTSEPSQQSSAPFAHSAPQTPLAQAQPGPAVAAGQSASTSSTVTHNQNTSTQTTDPSATSTTNAVPQTSTANSTQATNTQSSSTTTASTTASPSTATGSGKDDEDQNAGVQIAIGTSTSSEGTTAPSNSTQNSTVTSSQSTPASQANHASSTLPAQRQAGPIGSGAQQAGNIAAAPLPPQGTGQASGTGTAQQSTQSSSDPDPNATAAANAQGQGAQPDPTQSLPNVQIVGTQEPQQDPTAQTMQDPTAQPAQDPQPQTQDPATTTQPSQTAEEKPLVSTSPDGTLLVSYGGGVSAWQSPDGKVSILTADGDLTQFVGKIVVDELGKVKIFDANNNLIDPKADYDNAHAGLKANIQPDGANSDPANGIKTSPGLGVGLPMLNNPVGSTPIVGAVNTSGSGDDGSNLGSPLALNPVGSDPTTGSTNPLGSIGSAIDGANPLGSVGSSTSTNATNPISSSGNSSTIEVNPLGPVGFAPTNGAGSMGEVLGSSTSNPVSSNSGSTIDIGNLGSGSLSIPVGSNLDPGNGSVTIPSGGLLTTDPFSSGVNTGTKSPHVGSGALNGALPGLGSGNIGDALSGAAGGALGNLMNGGSAPTTTSFDITTPISYNTPIDRNPVPAPITSTPSVTPVTPADAFSTPVTTPTIPVDESSPIAFITPPVATPLPDMIEPPVTVPPESIENDTATPIPLPTLPAPTDGVTPQPPVADPSANPIPAPEPQPAPIDNNPLPADPVVPAAPPADPTHNDPQPSDPTVPNPQPIPTPDPVSGQPVDPRTGLPYDPVSNDLLDPITGRPIGEYNPTPVQQPAVAPDMPDDQIALVAPPIEHSDKQIIEKDESGEFDLKQHVPVDESVYDAPRVDATEFEGVASSVDGGRRSLVDQLTNELTRIHDNIETRLEELMNSGHHHDQQSGDRKTGSDRDDFDTRNDEDAVKEAVEEERVEEALENRRRLKADEERRREEEEERLRKRKEEIKKVSDAMNAVIATSRRNELERVRKLLEQQRKIEEFISQDTRQTKYTVKYGETLEVIAKKFFKDVRVALLIYDINRSKVAMSKIDGKVIYTVKAGTTLMLPSPRQAREWAMRNKYMPASEPESAPPVMSAADKAALDERVKNIEKVLGALDVVGPASSDTGIHYNVRLGDTLRSIAMKHPLLNDVALWRLLADKNGIDLATDERGIPKAQLKRGTRLVMPTRDEIVEFRKTIGVLTHPASTWVNGVDSSWSTKKCACKQTLPLGVSICPSCGHIFENETDTTARKTVLTVVKSKKSKGVQTKDEPNTVEPKEKKPGIVTKDDQAVITGEEPTVVTTGNRGGVSTSDEERLHSRIEESKGMVNTGGNKPYVSTGQDLGIHGSEDSTVVVTGQPGQPAVAASSPDPDLDSEITRSLSPVTTPKSQAEEITAKLEDPDLHADTVVVDGSSKPPISDNSSASESLMQSISYLHGRDSKSLSGSPISESVVTGDPITDGGIPTGDPQDISGAQMKVQRTIVPFSPTCRLLQLDSQRGDKRNIRLQLEVQKDDKWVAVLAYEIGEKSVRHEYSLTGKTKSMRVDLPSAALEAMVQNDISRNWESYCENFLNGKKVSA